MLHGAKVASTLPRPTGLRNGIVGSFLVAHDNGFVAQLSNEEAAAAISRREINDSHYKLSDHDCCSERADRGRTSGHLGEKTKVGGKEGQDLGYLARPGRIF